MTVQHKMIEARPAPGNTVGPIAWLRINLFSGPVNTVFTLLGLYLLYVLLTPTIQWAFINADWVGTSRDDCSREGACWVFVNARLTQFIYGLYPRTELWRVNIVFATFAVLIAWLAIPRLPLKRWVALATLVAFPVFAFFLLYGGYFGLRVVETHRWGGLMLTLILAVVGMVAALPIGILLALGRRSQMPIVKSFCVVFIEFWRGVPLITILFMASVMLPLFLPTGVSVDRLVRALIGITLFQSAYMAEVIRGGLQAIPRGQEEAAAALGMGYWMRMGLIVLPQALKMMIPGIVNTFISLFKDTTLVMIIGLFDLLGIVQAALSDSRWLGFALEGYVFAAFMFWIFCFSMSRYSQYLERKLHTGHKR
ncbi:amino acid ABC transporter permease [Billgrantia desiderata]|mgnify:FL=1|uniref:Amino acid ABC transporter permease n=1 Tax=Billgrantia desiderata TaxID=52021 RepID=A0AAW4YWU5_9GAMM|nr:amino acid ABC transporter permease [Halomonas desiderata]MCE8053093.1 amino acid ABC transporter permease [Halomonas desiderata]NIC36821.1 amino acid ABC transporter permease [Halomonas desiderata]OUE44378.1 amino acid ABC transporter permease [Halomonas desiderata SP1]SEG37047.1 general L-amino acid transport system permease protein [Halomonas desiderata]